jgi:hypothetical protein
VPAIAIPMPVSKQQVIELLSRTKYVALNRSARSNQIAQRLMFRIWNDD